MSHAPQTDPLVAALEVQYGQLAAIAELIDYGRRRIAPALDDLRWTGPASVAYLAARWGLDAELASAVEALAEARDSTLTALHTLESRV